MSSARQERTFRQFRQLQVAALKLTVDGLVAKPKEFDIQDLIARMLLKSASIGCAASRPPPMVIPWIGFPLRSSLCRWNPRFGQHIAFTGLVRPEEMLAKLVSRVLDWPSYRGPASR